MEQQAGSKNTKIIVGVVLIIILAALYIVSMSRSGDTASTVSDAPTTTSQTAPDTTRTSQTPAAASTGSYKDGSYSASAEYQTPDGPEEIDVNITLKDGVVTGTSVAQTANDSKAVRYQAAFKENYQDLVVGKKIDEVQLSRVSGSSLTSIGFNDAVDQIESQAKG